MHVVLIQPPDGAAAVASLRFSRRNPATLAPDWNVLCLQAYLKDHSRHLSTIVDCRLFTDLELELEHAVNAVTGPKIIAVHTSTANIGETAAVLELSTIVTDSDSHCLFLCEYSGSHSSRTQAMQFVHRSPYVVP